jgi:hypothetical protein
LDGNTSLRFIAIAPQTSNIFALVSALQLFMHSGPLMGLKTVTFNLGWDVDPDGKAWSDLDAALAQVKDTLEAVHIGRQRDPVLERAPGLARLERWLPSVAGKILPGVPVWPYE